MRNENDSQRKCNAIKITIFSAVFDGFWFSSVLTTNTSPLGEPQTESLFTWPLHRLFPIPCSELDVSTRVFLFIAVEFNFPFHSSWFARWKYRTWSSKTVLSLLPGGVKFSKSHFPEIWPSAEAEGAAIDYACRSTQIFFPRNLSEDYLDFCRNVCLRNCNLRDFSLLWAQSWMFRRRKMLAG